MTQAQTSQPQSGSPDGTAPERIAKVIARAGLCSRRDAERWIAEGRVAVDGTVLTSPAVTVTADNHVVVDGKPLPEPERPRLWRYHKPTGLVTTHRDEHDRPTVFGSLPAELPRLISIGRLDLNSEGLLLLTNDGALARRLELPATGWARRYRVRVHGMVEPERLTALARGTTIEGIAYGEIRAQLDRQQGANAWLTMSLQEGKNREVRRVLEHLGYPVSRLIRIAYGPFQLGNLARAGIEEVQQKVLREQLGLGAKPPGAQPKSAPSKSAQPKSAQPKSPRPQSPKPAAARKTPPSQHARGAGKPAPARPTARPAARPTARPRNRPGSAPSRG